MTFVKDKFETQIFHYFYTLIAHQTIFSFLDFLKKQLFNIRNRSKQYINCSQGFCVIVSDEQCVIWTNLMGKYICFLLPYYCTYRLNQNQKKHKDFTINRKIHFAWQNTKSTSTLCSNILLYTGVGCYFGWHDSLQNKYVTLSLNHPKHSKTTASLNFIFFLNKSPPQSGTTCPF